jgi:Ca-activated chloride channel family protein
MMKTMKRVLWVPALMMVALAVGVLPQAGARAGSDGQVRLGLSLGQPVLLADRVQRTWIKISLEGLPLQEDAERVPLNVALVLDRSGSMNGEKLDQAKEAALTALDYLNEDDIFSLVTYDSTVHVLVAATRVGDRYELRRAIESIRARGNTALFAGVGKGAAEVRKFLDDRHVNRVILLSDGLANVGPSSPDELGRLGRRLGREGIAVTTIGLGLGYNEDLMVQLAGNSDGNHVFVEEASDLARIFRNEFGELATVVAQDLTVIIDCAPGVRPLRLLGREGRISGQRVEVRLTQLYAMQEKYLTLEVEVPATEARRKRALATVALDWDDLGSHRRERASMSGEVSFSVRKAEVEEKLDTDVMAAVSEQQAVVASKEAVKLRDAGKREEAEQLLKKNAAKLKREARVYAAPKLLQQSMEMEVDSRNISKDKDWNRNRKVLRSKQYGIERQQSYK